MTTVNPYLSFNGNCEEAFNFYKEVFSSDFQYVGRYKDAPPADRQNFAAGDEKIMHISLPISKETILMGCDSPETFGQAVSFGNNISLSISTDSKVSADKIFNRLCIGGQVKMPMNETFWGAYFGVVTDKFGIHWTVSADLNAS
jgi:PhnB protein